MSPQAKKRSTYKKMGLKLKSFTQQRKLLTKKEKKEKKKKNLTECEKIFAIVQ